MGIATKSAMNSSELLFIHFLKINYLVNMVSVCVVRDSVANKNINQQSCQ